MAYLGAALTFPLGGGLYSPYIVNLAPGPAEVDAGVTRHVRMSIRDLETHIVGSAVRVVVSYSQQFADGTERFDDVTRMSGTFLSSINANPIDDVEADIQVVGSGIQITKNQTDSQKSVFYTSLEGGNNYISALATAVVKPNTITPDATGAVFGLEHGQRNTGAYVFFDNPSGLMQVRLAGPADGTGTRVPNSSTSWDWSAYAYRYVLIWNEIEDRVELYAIGDGNTTSLLDAQDISLFQQYETQSTGSPTPLRGGQSAITMFYGIEGPTNDRVTIGNVAVTTDVGFPIIGNTVPGYYRTIRQTDEIVRYDGGDPINASLSSWFGPDDEFLTDPDPDGEVNILYNYDGQPVQLIKNTPDKTFAIYREEPGFIGSSDNGILLDATFYARKGTNIGTFITGMGFLINDTESVFCLTLLDDASYRTIGLLGDGTGPGVSADYNRVPQEIDWIESTRIRMTIDPRRGWVEIYADGDYVNPVLRKEFDRAGFPTVADFSMSAVPAFICFGHPYDLSTTGTFVLERLHYSHLYQAYEARDGDLPDSADPKWLLTTAGFQDPSPLYGLHLFGGGFGPTPLGYYVHAGVGPGGSSTIIDNQLRISCDPGETQIYFRSVDCAINQGAALDIRVKFTDWKPKSRTGTFLVIDDGTSSYMLSFIDTEIGKFVALCVRAGFDSFEEAVGTEGDDSKYSFKLDWTEAHTYRLERRPLDGVYVFVDDAAEPELVLLDWEDDPDWPATQFNEPIIAFGQFSREGSVSVWDHVRAQLSRGYEVSTIKDAATVELEDEHASTQCVVVAYAEDSD